MNISIFASIGCQNLGDELILKNEVKLFENGLVPGLENVKNVKFKVFTYDVNNPFFIKDNVSYLEYFPIGIKERKNLFRNINNFYNFLKVIIWSDFIVIGGGGIIYDNEVQANKNPLDQFIFRNKFFKFFRKKVVFYAIGINIKQKENLPKLVQIFSKAYKVFVRDSYSYKTLQDIGIKSEVIDDPVFNDRVEYRMQNTEDRECEKFDLSENGIIKNNGKEQEDFVHKKGKQKAENSYLIKEIETYNFSLKDLENVDLENKNIGITFRASYIGKSGNEKIEIFMIRELIELLLLKHSKVFFLPHSINLTDIKSNDLEYYKKIISGTKFEDKVYIAETLEDVYSFYKEKKIDLCLAMRLHSMILSQVYEIPFVAFSYSKKTEELVKKIRNKELIQKVGE